MYYSDSIKENLTEGDKRYLAELRKELKNLELLGKSNSREWWSIVESIGEIENNL